MTKTYPNRLSTHLIRSTARRAQHRYERLQDEARNEMAPYHAQAILQCASLGIGPNDKIEVQRAVHERGKWRVVAV